MIATKEMRLSAFIEMAKTLKDGTGLGLTLENFIVLVDNIQLKYGYTDEEIKPIWDIINPPVIETIEEEVVAETPTI